MFWDKCEADLENMKCTLVDEDTKSAKVIIEDAQMKFEGYDVGLGCNIITGGDEYRYFVGLDYDETYEFVTQLRMKDGIEATLEEILKKNFDGTEAFSKFMEFCKEHNIKYVFYSL